MRAPQSPRQEHWERLYREKDSGERSWFQSRPGVALGLIEELVLPATARVIDVGGGTSRLVDELLDRGFEQLTVVDISGAALAELRSRLGDRAAQVTLVEADVTAAPLWGPYDLWHDRAVFHFLTDPDDRARYRERLRRALRPGGHAIIATFALDGPERCSGLPVVRYGPDTLQEELGEGFELQASRRELHHTPAGRPQRFIYCVFVRR